MKLVSKEQALELLNKAWTPIAEVQTVPLDEAYGRVLAEPQFARHSLPVVRAAIMDSVALRSADFTGGMPDTSHWRRGVEYDRADMGDDFDDAFDCAIAVESVTFLENGGIAIEADTELRAGLGIKPMGDTVRAGELLLPAGVRLTACDLAALAVGGVTQVPVRRRPVVAVIPTGSELVPRGTVPVRGENIDSNSLMLELMLREMGAQPLVFPIVRDAAAQMAAALDRALEQADIVVVGGGSSMGGEDFSTELLRQRGEFLFHGVSRVPGRPLSISVAGDKPVINLPGPPLAAFNGADWCLRAAVSRFLGLAPEEPLKVPVRLTAPLDTPPQMEFVTRISVSRGADGTLLARPLSMKATSLAQSLTANAMLISPVGTGRLEAGQTVEAVLLRNPSAIPDEA